MNIYHILLIKPLVSECFPFSCERSVPLSKSFDLPYCPKTLFSSSIPNFFKKENVEENLTVLRRSSLSLAFRKFVLFYKESVESAYPFQIPQHSVLWSWILYPISSFENNLRNGLWNIWKCSLGKNHKNYLVTNNSKHFRGKKIPGFSFIYFS